MKALGKVLFAGVLIFSFNACSDDDDGNSGGTSACGLTCTGTVVCQTPMGTDTGTASVQNGACVLTAEAGNATATLRCDGSASLSSPDGTDQGTWSGEGTQVTITASDGTYSCTITPPEGTGGSGGGSAGTGGTSGGPSGGTGGGSSGNPCTDCLESYCSAEMAACDADAQCLSLAGCVADCSTEACVQGCAEQYPGGVDLLIDFMDCADASCTEAC